MKKCLKAIQVSADVFEAILYSFNDYINEVDCIDSYMNGYEDKHIIYKEPNQLIIQAYKLNWLCKQEVIPTAEDWKQIIVRCVGGLGENTIVPTDISGPQAKKYIEEQVIFKKYSEEEYKEILEEHYESEDEELKQQHYVYTQLDHILTFENCYYYDINNAHGSALLELFPRCEKIINNMYEHRKDNDGLHKKHFNYYWGMLGKKGSETRGAYNWVVHRTTKILTELANKVEGLNIYINTDGIMVSDPINPIESSAKLGEFKLEKGKIYTYQTNNYWLLQFVKDDGEVIFKGNLPIKLRKQVDLSTGRVVHYKRIKVDKHYEYEDIWYENIW